MAAAHSIVYIHYGSALAAQPFNKGWGKVRGTAILPSGQATCTIANIPNLTDLSVVRIEQQTNNNSNTNGLINIKASNTNGMVGTVTIGTGDGSNASADTAFMFDVENP
jgi:hypothetical protein